MDMQRFTEHQVRAMDYHVLCGTIDCLPNNHPDLKLLLSEAERRRMARPSIRHYAEMMR